MRLIVRFEEIGPLKESKSRGRRPANAAPESGKPETMGARIRSGRQALGLTQKELEERVDLSTSSQQKYESDRSEPGSDALVKYATAGLNVNYLLLGEGEPLVPPKHQAAHVDAMRDVLLNDPAAADARLKRTGEALREVMLGVSQALLELGLTMSEEKKAALVSSLMELYLDGASPPNRGTILRLVKSAA